MCVEVVVEVALTAAIALVRHFRAPVADKEGVPEHKIRVLLHKQDFVREGTRLKGGRTGVNNCYEER